ncbi:hypothetical protein GYMLUDRAFT_52476 [Collybiopsis luxurians FD-317 M1]|nr:hypothetical protein GYMLUDRAFT_52476 [Collybiopsis luxurians FD-317 M1]
MSASPTATLDGDQNQTAWREKDEQKMGSSTVNGGDDHHTVPAQDTENTADFSRSASVGDASIPPKPDLESSYREKQVKQLATLAFLEPCKSHETQIWAGPCYVRPNKVYIGGLPEHTRREDLQNCFGEIGNIVAIELKVGYGFVEFDTREAAEISVNKYHEGLFMGNKIRVELSRGGGRTAKYSNDPLSCFRCGQVGHWARQVFSSSNTRTSNSFLSAENAQFILAHLLAVAPLIDRISRSRDYTPPPPSRDYRDSRDARDARDPRYDYPPRDYRRPPSPPPRDYYPPPPRSRYDDYPKERDRHALPPPPDYRSSRYPEPAYRGPPPPAPYPASDRYSRESKYTSYQPPPVSAGRPRTPPRYRDDYPPPRDYDYRDRDRDRDRGRPMTPPRYSDYPPRGAVTPERYSRRSASPPPRSSAYDYPPVAQNGHYATTPPGPPPPRSSRDYSRSGREADVYRRG